LDLRVAVAVATTERTVRTDRAHRVVNRVRPDRVDSQVPADRVPDQARAGRVVDLAVRVDQVAEQEDRVHDNNYDARWT